MTVSELVTLLMDINPDAKIFVKGEFYEDSGLSDPVIKTHADGQLVVIE